MHSPELAVQFAGWGYARLSPAEIAPLRRHLPAWAVAGTPGHFFKHADEQSILAARAVDDAFQRHGFDPREHQDFAVIAAPRFLGRQVSAALMQRFRKDGAQGVSPHIIPQHSLHSVSGAVSVLLGCKGPNVGVGGGPRSLDDALLTQFTLFDQENIPGVWLVGTGWDPEPVIDLDGNALNEPECFAFAFAVQRAAGTATNGSMRLRTDHLSLGEMNSRESTIAEITTADLVRQMQLADRRHAPLQMKWQLNWGAVLEIELNQPAALLSRAV